MICDYVHTLIGIPTARRKGSPMGHRIGRTAACAAAAACALTMTGGAAALAAESADGGLDVAITFPGADSGAVPAGGLDGRVFLLVAPLGEDPLDTVGDVTAEGTTVFGQDVDDVRPGETVTLSGGGAGDSDTGVYGWPHESLDQLPAGQYTVRPFVSLYDTVTRSDGSTVKVHFPCGDGGWFWDTPGSLVGEATDVSVAATGGDQQIDLALDGVVPGADGDGPEIGGCQQGNYADTATVKHVKIRSEALSDFWGRDMYIGANITLPPGYDPADTQTRYPVIYDQGHWPGGQGAYRGRSIDGFLTVTIRQESPFYDDAYGVNSANVGPWGDAIADELIPAIDAAFPTIAQPYARVVDGGSTGGWVSLASLVFRPDVFGSTWSYYPDSLDFHAHQQIDIYDGGNAYDAADGTPLGSWRTFDGDTERITVTMSQENRMELALGTNSRSFDQWDIWNAVYGVQGVNGYPLDPWEKESGVIDTDTAQLWRPMDLTDYVRTNWESDRKLGEALADRIHVSVGTHDNYYLDGGVELFKQTVEELGGADWADVTIIPGLRHGGYYNNLSLDAFLAQVRQWVADHAPDGPTPLGAEATAASTRGNVFADVLAHGGAGAAAARQSDPVIDEGDPVAGSGDEDVAPGATLTASFGTWDPAMTVTGEWLVDGVPVGDPVTPLDADGHPLTRAALADATATRAVAEADAGTTIAFQVTGTKRGYAPETRVSGAVTVADAATPDPSGSASPGGSATPSGGSPSGASPASSTAAQDGLASTGAGGLGAMIAIAGALLVGGAALAGVRRRTGRG